MKIKILFQYHTNMRDTVQALQTIASVQYLSYRTSNLAPDIVNIQPKTIGRRHKIYRPLKLWRLLGKDTDILLLKHINDPINLVPYCLCWLKNIRCVVLTQRIAHKSFPGYPTMLHALLAFLRAQKVVVLATTRDGYRQLKPYVPRTWYVPACIDAQRFTKRRYDLNPPAQRRLSVLSVSKYQERKNIPLLIDAIALLKQRFPHLDIRLTVIGRLSSDPRRASLYNRIERRVIRRKLMGVVELLSNIPHEQMARYYARADIFVLPAVREPLGYAVLEAMASGSPVVCSTDAGAASYVAPNINGYTVTPNSAHALSEILASCVDSHGFVRVAMLSRLGAGSTRITERNHAPTAFLGRFQKALATP